MSGAKPEARSSSCAASDSAKGRPQPHHVDDPPIDKDKVASRLQASGMELELDKFMGTITATESPDAVIKTIASTKGIQFYETG
ncbi:uncharacterized protein A1O5_04891 [Cladophialophora psammophila CBS 110553]|uniref:Uncharacterized protein n=1 Tax=Cladophialophora psammophila CBS 110553 TaxID=1182543 RepID=W9WW25_9EURO|nr:uncharacterized protein A1O5_04891 [Cladophialophora psammophila CBS 110553]EXJ72387.1 hypothetical protein A1O5_04891 [Cladophialophora psammophila CBS 110553]